MKIRFRQTGGFAGLAKTVEMESEELPPEERRALEELVAHPPAGATAPPGPPSAPGAPSSGGADMEQYVLTVEGQGGEPPRTLFLTRSQIPEEQRSLLRHLAGKARYEKR